MALTVTLDYPLRIIKEPGYFQYFSAQRLKENAVPSSAENLKRIFSDPTTGTLMLYPRNIDPDFLNTVAQASSIIRLADQVIHPDDSTNRTIFEEFAFGNDQNYYIYHSPVGFPGVPSFGPPGAGPSLTGAPTGVAVDAGLATIADETLAPIQTYAGDPETPSGSVTSGRVLSYTRDPLPVNAPVMLRWFHPNPKIGHQTRYIFYVGQLAIEIVGNMVIVYRDTSPGGDRASFERIWGKPMFGPSDFAPEGTERYFGLTFSPEFESHDRYLVVLPYFRNRVLLLASNGTAYSVAVKGEPKTAPGSVITGPATDSYSFEVTRSDTLMVWCVTPAPGRYQIQRLYFAHETGVPVRIHLPPITMDYTPVDTPTTSLNIDQDRGTSIDANVSFPAAYTFPVNDLSRCPAPLTQATSQSRTYGVALNFHGESTHRWTPFFYGLQFTASPTFQDNITTPVTVTDTGLASTYIVANEGHVSWGEKAGDGRAELGVLDESPYSLAPYYYAAGRPVQIADGATAIFSGWLDPVDLRSHSPQSRPNIITLRAVDRWKQLADTVLRDQRDWSDTGHITVVLSAAQQGGIDTTGAETPPLTNTYNTPLGGLNPRTPQDTRALNPGWKPQGDETAASFIQRIAEQFSGWDVGFRADGTFYYLPKNYFTALTLRFFNSPADRTAAGIGFETNPLIRDPVDFSTLEPEYNVVQVVGGAGKDGTVMRSSLLVDWASILNPAAVNYIGRHKTLIQAIPGVYSCAELNRIARVIFDQVRRRRRFVSFQADFVPTLKLSQRIEVGTYGFYRMRGVKADLTRSNWHEAMYIAELDEMGYNT